MCACVGGGGNTSHEPSYCARVLYLLRNSKQLFLVTSYFSGKVSDESYLGWKESSTALCYMELLSTAGVAPGPDLASWHWTPYGSCQELRSVHIYEKFTHGP